MFEAFQRNFTPDPNQVSEASAVRPDLGTPDLNELIARFGGNSFNTGLYRVVRASDVREWNARVSLGFPEFANRITCFGYDWLGRVYAADAERLEQDQPGVTMFDPGTGEVSLVPANVRTFHDEGLVEFGEAALALNVHREWMASGEAEPAYMECIGYRQPLFLGGIDDLKNLERSDLDVYWHLMGQLIVQIRNLPPGTQVRVTIGG